MDELDRKALYWCLKLSRMAVYNQLYFGEDPVQLREGVDSRTALLQNGCLAQSSTIMMELGRELDID